MRFLLLAFFVATFSSILKGEVEEQKFIPTKSEVNNALFRLYSELKCPPIYHFESTEYPYAYCINKLYYDKKNDLVIFQYRVFSGYSKLIADRGISSEKEAFKTVLELVALEIGIDVFGKSQAFGVIDRFYFSNLDEHMRVSMSWRKFIRDRAIVSLLYVNKNKEWVQAANDLSKNYYFSSSKRPKRLKDFIKLNQTQ